MKVRTTIAASIAVLTASLFGMPGLANAQAYGNWCSDGATLYNDPRGNSVPSPQTCIFPAANWSYFHRSRHYGPVLRQREPHYKYRWWMLY